MNQLQNWFSSPISPPIYQAPFYINASRVVLLLATIFVHLSSTSLHPTFPISESTVWVSWLISLYCLVVLALSYTHTFVKQNLYLFIFLLFYLVMFTLLQRVYFSRFDPQVNFLYLSISLLCSLFFNRKEHLLAFQLFGFIILAIAALSVDKTNEMVWVVIGRYLLLHCFIYFAIGFRIDRGQKLRQQDQQYKYLFERLNDGIMFISPLGRIQFVNDQLCEITAYSKTELLGMFVGKLILTAEESEIISSNGEKTSLIVAEGVERKLLRKDGREIWIRFSGSTINNRNQLLGYVGVCADITEQKETEQKLRQYSEKLSLTNKELEQFSYFASHDLKAPIHTISSFASLLQDYYAKSKAVDKEARKSIEIILRDSQRMNKLVDALQIYTGSGSEALEKRLVDMNEAIKEASENLAGFIHTNDAHIHSEDLPVIEADQVQIVRLIQNLIENAIIYRKDHSPVIHISASLNNSSTGYIFSFEDNGVGIDAKDYEKIFVMFQKVHTAQSEGLGIGLAVCKKIVENHKGRIWLKSVRGRGTTVYFFIPTKVHV